MKLIETPLNSNVNLETLYPNLTKYFFDKRPAVKLLKLFARRSFTLTALIQLIYCC